MPAPVLRLGLTSILQTARSVSLVTRSGRLNRLTNSALHQQKQQRNLILMAALAKPRRFAPLDPARSNTHGAPKLRGIVFDVDGTLW